MFGLDEVAVMHRLTRAQRSAEHLCHYPIVLGDPSLLGLGVGMVLRRALDVDIAFRIDPSSIGC